MTYPSEGRDLCLSIPVVIAIANGLCKVHRLGLEEHLQALMSYIDLDLLSSSSGFIVLDTDWAPCHVATDLV